MFQEILHLVAHIPFMGDQGRTENRISAAPVPTGFITDPYRLCGHSHGAQ